MVVCWLRLNDGLQSGEPNEKQTISRVVHLYCPLCFDVSAAKDQREAFPILATMTSNNKDDSNGTEMSPRHGKSSCESPSLRNKRKKKAQAMERMTTLLDEFRHSSSNLSAAPSTDESPLPSPLSSPLPPLSPRPVNPLRSPRRKSKIDSMNADKNQSSSRRSGRDYRSTDRANHSPQHAVRCSPQRSQSKKNTKKSKSFINENDGSPIRRPSTPLDANTQEEHHSSICMPQHGRRMRPSSQMMVKSKSMSSIRKGRSIIVPEEGNHEENMQQQRRSRTLRQSSFTRQQRGSTSLPREGKHQQQRRAQSLIDQASIAKAATAITTMSPSPLSPAPRIVLPRRNSSNSPNKLSKGALLANQQLATTWKHGSTRSIMNLPLSNDSDHSNNNDGNSNINTMVFHSSSPCIFTNSKLEHKSKQAEEGGGHADSFFKTAEKLAGSFSMFDNNNETDDDASIGVSDLFTSNKSTTELKDLCNQSIPSIVIPGLQVANEKDEDIENSKIWMEIDGTIARSSSHGDAATPIATSHKAKNEKEENAIDITAAMEKSLRKMNDSDPFLTFETDDEDDDDIISFNEDDTKSFRCPFARTLPVSTHDNNDPQLLAQALNGCCDEKSSVLDNVCNESTKTVGLRDYLELHHNDTKQETRNATNSGDDSCNIFHGKDQDTDVAMIVSVASVTTSVHDQNKPSVRNDAAQSPTSVISPLCKDLQDIDITFTSSSNSDSNPLTEESSRNDDSHQESGSNTVLDVGSANVDEVLSRSSQFSSFPVSPRMQSRRQRQHDTREKSSKLLSPRRRTISKSDYSPLMTTDSTTESSRSTRSLYSSLLWKPPLPLLSPSSSSRRRVLKYADSSVSTSTDDTVSLTENSEEVEEQWSTA